MSLFTLCRTGALVEKKNHILSILEKRFDQPLKSEGIPTMALIAAKVNDEDQDELEVDVDKRDYEPLIARTYEYPNRLNNKPLAKSTSSMKLFEAMAATSSVPPLFDRVRVNIDGKVRALADGTIFQCCPLSLAIDEARRLYPGRPLGVILNLGFNDGEHNFIERTITTARIAHPNLHFQRISPDVIMDNFSSIETDSEKVATMEAQVKHWMSNTPRIRNLTKVTMKKLFETGPRQFDKKKFEPSETEQEPRQFGKNSENKIAAMEAQVKQQVLNSRKELKNKSSKKLFEMVSRRILRTRNLKIPRSAFWRIGN